MTFYRDYVWESLQEVASDAKNTRKCTRKNSCARTRDFGTQTSPKVKSWVPTKRYESCSVGVQVDRDTPVLRSPAADNPNVNSSNSNPVRVNDSAAEISPASNSSVEVCSHCKQTFVRETLPKTSSNSYFKNETRRKHSKA